MTDAQSAIVDIQEALVEHGSAITLITVAQTGYDPATGATETTVSTATKAIIKQYASSEVSQRIIGNTDLSSYQLSALFYFNGTVDVGDRITFRGETMNIIYVFPLYLQDIIVKYEVLLKS